MIPFMLNMRTGRTYVDHVGYFIWYKNLKIATVMAYRGLKLINILSQPSSKDSNEPNVGVPLIWCVSGKRIGVMASRYLV